MKERWDRFWFDFKVSDFHLSTFRVTFFCLFAVDLWLQVTHAPRYGAGDFNVAHFPFLESLLPSPSRTRMLVLFTLQSYLAFLIAFARLPRLWTFVLAALFGYSYLISQLDSYQHHWLMFLLLFTLGFQSWQPRQQGEDTLGDWPLRLVLAVVSLVYFWAIVTKLDPLWLDGQTISSQVRAEWARGAIERTLDPFKSPEPMAAWANMAILVLVVEAALAIAIHVRWLRLPAALMGMAFHLGIEASGFKIGLFSYFMVAIYLLVLPIDDIPRWLSRWFPKLHSRDEETTRSGRFVQGAVLFIVGLAVFFVHGLGSDDGIEKYAVSVAPIGLGIARALSGVAPTFAIKRPIVIVSPILVPLILVFTLPFEQRIMISLLAFALLVAIAFTVASKELGSLRFTVAHLLACVSLAVLARGTDTARDYYRFWGGSSRRLGDTETATRAYRQVVRVDPGYASAHVKLGFLLTKSQPEEALEHFEKAQKLAPSNAKAFSGAARIHHDAKRGEEAYRAAQEAALLDPKNSAAVRIRDYWRERRP